jgi:hypothetical protein
MPIATGAQRTVGGRLLEPGTGIDGGDMTEPTIDDRQVLWDEAFRRAAEKGGDPEDHFRAIIQEAVDSLVRDGTFTPSGLD